MADVGTGTTIAFATSSFVAQIISLDGNDITRPDVDISHMGSTAFMEFMPGDLQDGGTIELEVLFDPDVQPPIAGAPEVITITFPIPAGGLTAATFIFNGYVNSWSWADPLEDKMTASISVKVDGTGTAPNWTAGT